MRTSVLPSVTEEDEVSLETPPGSVRASVVPSVVYVTPSVEVNNRSSSSVGTVSPAQHDTQEWDTFFDDEGTPYFCHRVTGETTWEKPL